MSLLWDARLKWVKYGGLAEDGEFYGLYIKSSEDQYIVKEITLAVNERW